MSSIVSLPYITVTLEFSNISKQEYVGMRWFREEEKNRKYVKKYYYGQKEQVFIFSKEIRPFSFPVIEDIIVRV